MNTINLNNLTINFEKLSTEQLLDLFATTHKEVSKRIREKQEPIVTKNTLTREDIVHLAKQAIEQLKSGEYYRLSGNGFGGYDCFAEFHVNKEKRVVTVLLKGFSSKKVWAKAIAKCDPQDCFNEHIGKAIALYRALGKNIPAEFTNTPQPEEKSQVGDIVEYLGKTYKIQNEWRANNKIAQPGSIVGTRGKIVDDSARY